MKTTNEQRNHIEAGHAMVYVAASGAEYYIEHVMDAYGRPSKPYADRYYIFGGDGEIVNDVKDPIDGLDSAKAYCEGL